MKEYTRPPANQFIKTMRLYRKSKFWKYLCYCNHYSGKPFFYIQDKECCWPQNKVHSKIKTPLNENN